MGRAGPELFSEKTPQGIENKEVASDSLKSQNGQKVHNRVHISNLPSDLQEIIDRWPSLPEQVKKQILDIVRNVRTDSDKQ